MSEVGLVRLYVSGTGPRAEEAWHTVRVACQHLPGSRFDVELVDISERPEAASQAGILLTPVLVRVRPGPERRWLGDFTSVGEIVHALSVVDP